nr:DUF2269 domain-containing protein [Corynebacterium mendelii]
MHIFAAIALLGPVTVATSGFAPKAKAAHNGDAVAKGSVAMLYRISHMYGLLSLLVPLLGIGVMIATGAYWRDGRFHVSILLSVIAWAVLIFLILPRQRAIAANLGVLPDADDKDRDKAAGVNWDKDPKMVSMFSGIFALLWVVIFILMVI